jgi:hypothetical protein
MVRTMVATIWFIAAAAEEAKAKKAVQTPSSCMVLTPFFPNIHNFCYGQ